AGQPLRPRGAFRRRSRGDARDAQGEGPRQALRPGQDPRQGRDLEEAHRARARLQRGRQGEDRGRRRFRPDSGVLMRRTIATAFSVADIRKKLAFTAAMLALYRLGAYIPAPGVDVDTLKKISEEQLSGGNILGFLNLFSGGSLSRL